jgi:hypothetical protein
MMKTTATTAETSVEAAAMVTAEVRAMAAAAMAADFSHFLPIIGEGHDTQWKVSEGWQ